MKLALLLLVALAAPARAHDLRPGILTFVEDGRHELRMRFVPPIDSRGEAIDLALVLPDGCTRTGDRVHCKHGFTGTLAVGGMRGHVMKIFVALERDGARRDWILTSESPRLALPPLPSRWPLLASIAAAIGALGGLALVLGATRRLAIAALAFVAGTLLPVSLPVLAPVVLLYLAAEATDDRETALRRWPVLAALLGVPFAAAPLSLGIGVAVATLVALVGKRGVVGLRAHRAAAYALGALAAWQLIARLASG